MQRKHIRFRVICLQIDFAIESQQRDDVRSFFVNQQFIGLIKNRINCSAILVDLNLINRKLDALFDSDPNWIRIDALIIVYFGWFSEASRQLSFISNTP